jgi:hypothetical protein
LIRESGTPCLASPSIVRGLQGKQKRTESSRTQMLMMELRCCREDPVHPPLPSDLEKKAQREK